MSCCAQPSTKVITCLLVCTAVITAVTTVVHRLANQAAASPNQLADVNQLALMHVPLRAVAVKLPVVIRAAAVDTKAACWPAFSSTSMAMVAATWVAIAAVLPLAPATAVVVV
jgi:hypothetical protein